KGQQPELSSSSRNSVIAPRAPCDVAMAATVAVIAPAALIGMADQGAGRGADRAAHHRAPDISGGRATDSRARQPADRRALFSLGLRSQGKRRNCSEHDLLHRILPHLRAMALEQQNREVSFRFLLRLTMCFSWPPAARAFVPPNHRQDAGCRFNPWCPSA